ncbi:MAG: spore germination protein [Firmicutes bacterium]|nr:spore germination protein [Bacillota bacterium]
MEEARSRLQKIDTDSIFESGGIEDFVEDNQRSPPTCYRGCWHVVMMLLKNFRWERSSVSCAMWRSQLQLFSPGSISL